MGGGVTRVFRLAIAPRNPQQSWTDWERYDVLPHVTHLEQRTIPNRKTSSNDTINCH